MSAPLVSEDGLLRGDGEGPSGEQSRSALTLPLNAFTGILLQVKDASRGNGRRYGRAAVVHDHLDREYGTAIGETARGTVSAETVARATQRWGSQRPAGHAAGAR